MNEQKERNRKYKEAEKDKRGDQLVSEIDAENRKKRIRFGALVFFMLVFVGFW